MNYEVTSFKSSDFAALLLEFWRFLFNAILNYHTVATVQTWSPVILSWSGYFVNVIERLTNLIFAIDFCSPDRDLSKRIEYLSRAKVNAKSITSALADSTTGGALLHEIEEKIEAGFGLIFYQGFDVFVFMKSF